MKVEQYTQQTQNLSARYNITPRDVLFLRLVASGADRAEAYATIYDHGKPTTYERSRTNANELLKNNPGAALCIQALKREIYRKTPTAANNTTSSTQTEDENAKKERERKREKFATRSGILDRLSDITEDLTGKDELQALQLLAKMQGLDKPDERTEDERRRFFLPWRSKCRACALMRAYLEIRGI